MTDHSFYFSTIGFCVCSARLQHFDSVGWFLLLVASVGVGASKEGRGRRRRRSRPRLLLTQPLFVWAKACWAWHTEKTMRSYLCTKHADTQPGIDTRWKSFHIPICQCNIDFLNILIFFIEIMEFFFKAYSYKKNKNKKIKNNVNDFKYLIMILKIN